MDNLFGNELVMKITQHNANEICMRFTHKTF